MRPENGAAQARDAHLARIPEPFGAIEAASLRNDGRYHHAVDLGSWMCFQASSAGPSAYCFAFSRKEGMSSKHCRAGPSRCSPARSGRVGLPLPRWLLPEVNSRSYAPRLRRVGVLRIEVGARCPFYLDPRHINLRRYARSSAVQDRAKNGPRACVEEEAYLQPLPPVVTPPQGRGNGTICPAQ